MDESSPPPSLQSNESTDVSLSPSEDAKRFLQSVCRAYYPKFTSAIEDTYYSCMVNTKIWRMISDDLLIVFSLLMAPHLAHRLPQWNLIKSTNFYFINDMLITKALRIFVYRSTQKNTRNFVYQTKCSILSNFQLLTKKTVLLSSLRMALIFKI